MEKFNVEIGDKAWYREGGEIFEGIVNNITENKPDKKGEQGWVGYDLTATGTVKTKGNLPSFKKGDFFVVWHSSEHGDEGIANCGWSLEKRSSNAVETLSDRSVRLNKETIFRGKRGGCGAPPDDSVSKALERLIGAKIVDIGFLNSLREGGLAIDYNNGVPGTVYRLVLGYNELGEWVELNAIHSINEEEVKKFKEDLPEINNLNDAEKLAAEMDKNITCYDLMKNKEERVIAIKHLDGTYLEFHSACCREIAKNWIAVFTEHHKYFVYEMDDLVWIKEWLKPKTLYGNKDI